MITMATNIVTQRLLYMLTVLFDFQILLKHCFSLINIIENTILFFFCFINMYSLEGSGFEPTQIIITKYPLVISCRDEYQVRFSIGTKVAVITIRLKYRGVFSRVSSCERSLNLCCRYRKFWRATALLNTPQIYNSTQTVRSEACSTERVLASARQHSLYPQHSFWRALALICGTLLRPGPIEGHVS